MRSLLRGLGWFTVFIITSFMLVWTLVIVPSFFWAFEPISLKTPRTVFIHQGLGAFEIAKLLVSEGIESDPYRPTALVFFLRWNTRLKSGEYAFNFPMNHIDVWRKIARGEVVRHIVTVVEGATISDIAESLERTGIVRKSEVTKKAKDRDFIRSLGFDENISTVEGYLFPATYDFTRQDTVETILKRMVREFRKRFKPEWLQQAKQLNLSLHQVVTLASMVEKEAIKEEERPIIAAVFMNRLRMGMPLQSDPTAVYDLENFKGPILRSHLERRSPYNTYMIKGLPPGPICNPGLASIKAVLFPANVKYLYFVSDRRGSHRFSNTYEEHLQAIREISAGLDQTEKEQR
ncbi:MAG: endolytic transglycosylase MltG [Syntrophobacterales bacterium]|nr:endolytic transglycosylase MltG [Syntrophobacterales bacterium]